MFITQETLLNDKLYSFRNSFLYIIKTLIKVNFGNKIHISITFFRNLELHILIILIFRLLLFIINS